MITDIAVVPEVSSLNFGSKILENLISSQYTGLKTLWYDI